MSFNYKPKIVLKNIKFEEVYEKYVSQSDNKDFLVHFQSSIEENRKCEFCSKLISIDEYIYGIPIGMRTIDSELEIDIFGTYCSLHCAYKKYKNIEEDSTKRKNIKFVESGQYFKCLFYKLFKSYNIEDFDNHIIDLKNIKFKKIKHI
jgi:hypothetical protein